MNDRYTKIVLTVIAGALIYLCIVITPLPGLNAQVTSQRPGVSSGPLDVVIVGWRTAETPFPVAVLNPVRVTATDPLPIRGAVTTERSSSFRADRVFVVGWEENGLRDQPGQPQSISSSKKSIFPVRTQQ
jgi:hypothetical protein